MVNSIISVLFKIWDYIMVKFSHPYIDLEIKYLVREQHPISIVPTSAETIPIGKGDYNYEFCWKYELTIKNNSTKPVLNIAFKEKPSFLYIYPELKKTESLQPFQEMKLNCVIKHNEKMKGKEAFEKLQEEFPYFIVEPIKIVLKYQNESHRSFYTTFIYDSNEQKNKYKKN